MECIYVSSRAGHWTDYFNLSNSVKYFLIPQEASHVQVDHYLCLVRVIRVITPNVDEYNVFA